MRVSERGLNCLHRITRTYLIRLMIEIKKITEHTPLHSFVRSKMLVKNLFVVKLTSYEYNADRLTAHVIANKVAEVFQEEKSNLKNYFTQDFKNKLLSE